MTLVNAGQNDAHATLMPRVGRCACAASIERTMNARSCNQSDAQPWRGSLEPGLTSSSAAAAAASTCSQEALRRPIVCNYQRALVTGGSLRQLKYHQTEAAPLVVVETNLRRVHRFFLSTSLLSKVVTRNLFRRCFLQSVSFLSCSSVFSTPRSGPWGTWGSAVSCPVYRTTFAATRHGPWAPNIPTNVFAAESARISVYLEPTGRLSAGCRRYISVKGYLKLEASVIVSQWTVCCHAVTYNKNNK